MQVQCQKCLSCPDDLFSLLNVQANSLQIFVKNSLFLKLIFRHLGLQLRGFFPPNNNSSDLAPELMEANILKPEVNDKTHKAPWPSILYSLLHHVVPTTNSQVQGRQENLQLRILNKYHFVPPYVHFSTDWEPILHAVLTCYLPRDVFSIHTTQKAQHENKHVFRVLRTLFKESQQVFVESIKTGISLRINQKEG